MFLFKIYLQKNSLTYTYYINLVARNMQRKQWKMEKTSSLKTDCDQTSTTKKTKKTYTHIDQKQKSLKNIS